MRNVFFFNIFFLSIPKSIFNIFFIYLIHDQGMSCKYKPKDSYVHSLSMRNIWLESSVLLNEVFACIKFDKTMLITRKVNLIK